MHSQIYTHTILKLMVNLNTEVREMEQTKENNSEDCVNRNLFAVLF